jgi:hypothetical protein
MLTAGEILQRAFSDNALEAVGAVQLLEYRMRLEAFTLLAPAPGGGLEKRTEASS